MPTVEVWIVMDESGGCEVATDETIAIDRWNDEFGGNFAGEAVCRIVKLNVTMSVPRQPDNDEKKSGVAVDVMVPDRAGQSGTVETE
jgi:hypothetical protein